jgi:hypothetical protein
VDRKSTLNQESDMNRFLRTYCYSFAHGSILTLALFGLGMCVVQAQVAVPRTNGPVVKPPPAAVPRTKGPVQQPEKPKPISNDYTRKHDLEVSSLSGTFVGKDIVLGGQIKNSGPAVYPGGRKILLYVSSGGRGWVQLRNDKFPAQVPPLKPQETWPIPTFTCKADSVPTNRFMVHIEGPALDRDLNRDNDEKTYDVTGVR